MICIERNEEYERAYEITINKDELQTILDLIVKMGSYKETGRFRAADDSEPDFENYCFVKGETLPNGSPAFEDIISFFRYKSNGQDGFQNDAIGVEGTKIILPKLAYIIEGLIHDNSDSVRDFILYPYDDELVSIDERIQNANAAVNHIDNADYSRKVNALGILRDLFDKKNKHEYFDVEFLKRMFNQAANAVSYQQISETTYTKGEKKLLKDFIPHIG